MPIYEIKSFNGGVSDFEDKGIAGAFKFGSGLDIRKSKDTLTCKQGFKDEGITVQSPSASVSPSASGSPSASSSPSSSNSVSPSSSASPSSGGSPSRSPSASVSPSHSVSMSASQSPSSSISRSISVSKAISSVFRDLILWWVTASDGNLYGFGNTGYIYKRTTDGSWSVVYKATGKIKGAEEKPSAGGKTYLEWSLDTEVHRKEIPGNLTWNDVDAVGTVQGDSWPKTNLTSADWHTMKEVAGDVMIANGPTLAMSAYDDSYTNEALDLIPGNLAKTLVERTGRAVIGTYRAADPDNGVNSAIDAEVPLAQVGKDGQLFYANLVDSIATKRFPGGGKSYPGGVANEVSQVNFFDWEVDATSWIDKQTVGNMALFGIFGADQGRGGLYSVGRYDKNHPFAMNLDYPMDVDEVGAVAHMNGLTFVSYRDDIDFGVKVTDLNSKTKAIYEGLDFYAPIKRVSEITTWDMVKLHMAPLPTNTSVEFWYRMNKFGNFIQAKSADGQTQFSTAAANEAVFSISTNGEIFEPRIVLNPAGNVTPEVYKARIFFN